MRPTGLLRRLCLGLAVTTAAMPMASSAAPTVPMAERYTAALLAEARLEEALRSLRACCRYAESATLPLGDAPGIVGRTEAALLRVRLGLQAEALSPDVASMDLDALRAETGAAAAVVTQAVESLRRALEPPSAAPTRWAVPGLPTAIAAAGSPPLTDQLIFAALGPTQGWHGWTEGPEAWSVFHQLGVQLMSPWFGHYWARPDAQVCDLSRMESVAATLERSGFPMLVWLEPEFDIDSLWTEIGAEMYLHDASGHWQKRTRINNTINIFHPRVREELCRVLERTARTHRGDHRILGYELIEEPALRFDAADPDGGATDFRYGGYSAAARSSFHQALQRRYGSIQELNRRWGAAYAEFAAVAPPAQLERREGTWPGAELPLLVEFQRFRAVEHAECFRQMVAALHRGNPGRPVLPQFTTALFGDPLGGVDLSRQAEAGWDILTFHTDTALAYVHSLARYQGKPIWNDEFIWTAASGRQPYITGKSMAGEREVRAHAAIELWRHLLWGARGVVLFNLDFAWSHPKDGGDWNNELLQGLTGKRQPRYAAAVFGTVLPRARTFFPELRDSVVVHEGVLILEPTTSLYAMVPTGTVQWWGTRLLAEAQKRFYRPAICPERYLVDGREDLEGIRVVVVPSAPYVPADVTARVHDWVRRGGALVTLGSFATHDEYGRPCPAEDPFAGDRPGPAAKVGAGRHVVIPAQVPAEPVISAVWDAVDAAVGRRAVSATDSRLELMLRQASGGHLLVVLNRDAGAPVAAEVRLGLPVRQVTDLMVDGGARVPAPARAPAGTLAVVLDPGEARAFWIE